MNQTPHAAAVLVPILATCGLIAMLTVFGLASRTATPPARPRVHPAPPAAHRVDVIEPLDVMEPATAQAPGWDGALVKQRGVSTPVA